MNECPVCKASYEGAFCPKCGSKYLDPACCPKCGTPKEGDPLFCAGCGHAFYHTNVKKAQAMKAKQDQRTQFYATHSEPTPPERSLSKKEYQKASVLYRHQMQRYKKADEREPNKLLLWLELHKLPVILMAVALALCVSMVALIITGVLLFLSWFNQGISVDPGDDLETVERRMGEADHTSSISNSETTDNGDIDIITTTYYYYDEDYTELLEEIEMINTILQKEDPSILEYLMMNVLKKREAKLEKKLETMEHKVIIITHETVFEYRNGVRDSYENVTMIRSAVCKGRINLEHLLNETKDVQYYIPLPQTVKVGTPDEEIELDVRIYYTDGSYCRMMVPQSAIAEANFDEVGTTLIQWKTNWGTHAFSVNVVE